MSDLPLLTLWISAVGKVQLFHETVIHICGHLDNLHRHP